MSTLMGHFVSFPKQCSSQEGPRGPYPPNSWGHMKKSGDSTINYQNFIENVPVGFRCGDFAPCNLFLLHPNRCKIQVNMENGKTDEH